MADKEQYPDKIILALRKKQQIKKLENTRMEELLKKKEMTGFSRKYFAGQKFSLFLPEDIPYYLPRRASATQQLFPIL